MSKTLEIRYDEQNHDVVIKINQFGFLVAVVDGYMYGAEEKSVDVLKEKVAGYVSRNFTSAGRIR